MEQSDDDLSDEDSDDDVTLVPLPCDLPTWPSVCALLKQLELCRTSCDIGRVLAELDCIANANSNFDDTSDINTIEYFLDEVCGEEERNIICFVLIPAIASIALNIYNSKPYIGVLKSQVGESEVRTLHPEFLASILAHSFLSTSGRVSLNLNIIKLDPKAAETHWKIRCYFHHFHQTIQNKKNKNVTFYKEITKKSNSAELKEFSNTNLIPFIAKEENEEIGQDTLRLYFCDDIRTGILPQSNPLNSEFGIKNLESLIPFLYIDKLSTTESMRIDLPQNGQLSIIQTPKIPRTEIGIRNALQSFFASVKPCTSYTENIKSVLRRPSVAAVTSADSESEDQKTKSSSKPSLSLSDSCINNMTDSELSYNLSDKENEARGKGKPGRKLKLRRKDTFNERLKAALDRGNTPDESDDQSLNRPPINAAPIHRKCLRRQRSTGFRAFNDNVEESDDFFTATEDEHSYTQAKSEKVSFKVITNNVLNPLTMRRKLLKDKSFDLSTSSAQVTSQSLPVSSLQTGSSNIFSDSSSISSEGLGMPNLQEDCMEDLCEKLTGCIETSEGGLQFRNIELRRAVKVLGVKSLSDTFLASIGDMDRFSYMTARQCVAAAEELEHCSLKRTFSSPNLCMGCDWSMSTGANQYQHQYNSVITQSFLSAGWRRQVWPLLVWLSASAVRTLKKVTFNTVGQEGLEDLGRTVDKLVSKNVKTVELLDIICEFVRGEEDNLFNFIDKRV